MRSRPPAMRSITPEALIAAPANLFVPDANLFGPVGGGSARRCIRGQEICARRAGICRRRGRICRRGPQIGIWGGGICNRSVVKSTSGVAPCRRSGAPCTSAKKHTQAGVQDDDTDGGQRVRLRRMQSKF
jgi:hypothetical protein